MDHWVNDPISDDCFRDHFYYEYGTRKYEIWRLHSYYSW